MRKKYLWKKAIQKSCNATEGIDSSFANYLIKSASIKRHFYWINGKKSLDNLYRSFVITIAFELHLFNTKEILRLPKEVIDFCDKFNTGQGNMYDTPIDFRKFSSGYLDGKCFGEQKRLQPARHASTI